MAYKAIATDDFNRANADPIGGNWTTITGQGNLKIVSNAVTFSVNNDSGIRYNTGTWPDDQYSQVKITDVGGTSTTGFGPVVRCASGAYTCYGLYVCASGVASDVVLYKRVAGAFTSLATRTQTYSAGDTFRIEAQGSTLRILYKAAAVSDFTQLGASFTDAVVSSGNPGIAYSSAVTSGSVDDWEAGSISAYPNNYQFVTASNGLLTGEKIR
jgi:hypothetical protein